MGNELINRINQLETMIKFIQEDVENKQCTMALINILTAQEMIAKIKDLANDK